MAAETLLSCSFLWMCEVLGVWRGGSSRGLCGDRQRNYSLDPLQISDMQLVVWVLFFSLSIVTAVGHSSYVLCECSSIQISRDYTKACLPGLCSLLRGLVFLLVVTAQF